MKQLATIAVLILGFVCAPQAKAFYFNLAIQNTEYYAPHAGAYSTGGYGGYNTYGGGNYQSGYNPYDYNTSGYWGGGCGTQYGSCGSTYDNGFYGGSSYYDTSLNPYSYDPYSQNNYYGGQGNNYTWNNYYNYPSYGGGGYGDGGYGGGGYGGGGYGGGGYGVCGGYGGYGGGGSCGGGYGGASQLPSYGGGYGSQYPSYGYGGYGGGGSIINSFNRLKIYSPVNINVYYPTQSMGGCGLYTSVCPSGPIFRQDPTIQPVGQDPVRFRIPRGFGSHQQF